MLADAANEES